MTTTAIFGSETGNNLELVFPEIDPFPWSVTREGEVITFKLGEGGDEKEEIHSTTVVREYLIKNYNWNGIVNMMHALEEKSDRLETYTRPTTLKGIPADDDVLIIPDEAIEAIIYEQAKYAIETTFVEAPQDNINDILKDVNGQPLDDFAENILSTTYDDFLKEVDNTEMSYEGTTVAMPNLKTVSEADLYDFLKGITLARNGLWLEDDGLTNLVSIRREIVTASNQDTGFNDSLLLAWKEGGVKKSSKYIATTEPGRLNTERGKLLPQSTTLFLGLHKFGTSKIQIPAGRTINNYRKKANSDGNEFSPDDDGINIHYASVSQRAPVGLPTSASSYGIGANNSNVGYTDVETEALLTAIEVYRYLADWGAGTSGTSISCYKNLENHTKTYTLSGIVGTTDATKKIEIKEGTNVEHDVKLSTYRTYVGANYGASSKKTNAVKLLMYHHNLTVDGTLASSYDDTSMANIVTELKKEEVFESIIKLQYSEELVFSNVDGKPGGGTITKIDRTAAQKTEDTTAFNEKIEKAESDWESLTASFETWGANADLSDALRDSLKTGLKIADERKDKSVTDIDDHGGQELEGNVGGWSYGCQVISGVQKFFHFMYDLSQFVESTDQERWYYTVIESSSLGITLD